MKKEIIYDICIYNLEGEEIGGFHTATLENVIDTINEEYGDINTLRYSINKL